MKPSFSQKFAALLGVGVIVALLVPAFLSGLNKARAYDSRASFPLAVWKADNGAIVGSIDQSGNLTVVGAVNGASISGTTLTGAGVTNAAAYQALIATNVIAGYARTLNAAGTNEVTRQAIAGPPTRYALQGTNGTSFALQVSNPADGTTNLLVFYGGIAVSNIAGYHQ